MINRIVMKVFFFTLQAQPEIYCNMKVLFLTAVIFVLSTGTNIFSQQAANEDINIDIKTKQWPSFWITCPGSPGKEYGIYYFRKTFDLDSDPGKFIIHISADNRYRLFVNGKSVCTGPARGDLQHWRFESVNIGSFLRKGKNVLAAVVWNFGDDAPNSQMTLRTGFIVAGNSGMEQAANTDGTWKVTRDKSYSAISGFGNQLNTYLVVGPGERIEADKHVWGWEQTGFDDSSWNRAETLWKGQPRTFGTNGDWMLVPRTIPLMEEKEQLLSTIRYSDGVKVPDNFLNGSGQLTIPPMSTVKILIDQGYLTTAYPVLMVRNGKNSTIRVSYAESLFNKDGSKGNRNETDGKEFRGNYDLFIPDGPERTFSTLWFRTYRYIQLEIKTSNDALILKSIKGIFTAYPLQEIASFRSDDTELDNIWKVGWRTARLCAGEIYFDCPYYEQMQYVGDTRIQSLISLYVSGDDRLMRNALELFDVSRISDGLTQSRYPSSSMQIIPPFSLYWVLMAHDYWMNRNDPDYVKSFLPGIESALGWFERRVAENGMLGPLSWWNFVDWADEWPWDQKRGTGGVPDGAAEGASSIVSLQFAYVLQKAAQLEAALGNPQIAQKYETLSGILLKNTYKLCWDPSKGLLADTPEKKTFSQHANIFGILSGIFPEKDRNEVMEKILNDKSLIQSTLYFRFYLVQALKATGMDNLYLENLVPWKKMIDTGLTTFAEKLDPTRSDCHAWSASPNYYFLSLVCGIEPGSEGFKSVKIHPNPGNLRLVEGTFPHPLGLIYVKYTISGKQMKADVELPAGLIGNFEWNGFKKELKEGKQEIIF
jgi:alpha-L-rhamnosidase